MEHINYGFSAEKFVQNLYEKGSEITCDITNYEFHCDEVPEFYNKDKFERGRMFVRKYYLSILFCKVVALMVGLADPIFNITLQKTGKSSIAKASYRRYKSTIRHILLWYRDDFKPKSKSWKSLKTVKAIHNKNSELISNKGLPRITQRDMAVTQMGFIMIILIPNTIGIFGARKEDFEGFIHMWRNFGKFLGIQDEFNVCRESLEETLNICNVLFHSLYPTYIQRMSEQDYVMMATAFVNGFKGVFPVTLDMMALSKYLLINYKYPNYPLDHLEYDDQTKKSIKTTLFIFKLFRFNLFRIIINCIAKFILWILLIITV